LAEAHHRAPRFRPLAFLAVLAFFTCPLRRRRFVVPDFAPGGFSFSGFSRAIPRLFDPCRGY
ncbi:MAG: hypothetical protein WCO90_07825, partial [Planctomycetota bacterium]